MKFLIQVFLLVGFTSVLVGQAPEWWTDREVIDSSKSPNDFAPINQGQLKHLATQAYHELQENLPGGGGAELQHLISFWSIGSDNDFLPVNLGQLKHLAKPFYDRLITVGFTDEYPWESSSNPPNDFALANIGQAKSLFSFDITYDSDLDGLPDWWEMYHFGSLVNLPEDISPGDSGLTMSEAFHLGRDPNVVASPELPRGAFVELEVYMSLLN